jgi:hypothetical protein
MGRLKPHSGAALARKGVMWCGASEMPADRGSRHGEAVVLLQVPGDGRRAVSRVLLDNSLCSVMISSIVVCGSWVGCCAGAATAGSNAASLPLGAVNSHSMHCRRVLLA